MFQNIDLNGLANCYPLSIAAYFTDTEIDLYAGADSAKNSIKQDFGKGSQKVKAKALDNVLKDLGVEKVNLIKVDVEEAEYDVLRGLENTLRCQAPTLMIELLKQDEREVIMYLQNLGYEEKLVHSYLPYKNGLMYYCFKKAPARQS